MMQSVCGTYRRQPMADRQRAVASTPHPATLLIATADGGTLRFHLAASPVRVGRAPDCDLVITEAMMG